ncbi:unnamed protein product [Clonostachys rosea]|uniref:Transcription factor domain-containing protein n=1 Tax=Bionectria ochroleuca TaxID=29856 RepID=A0ABY6TNU3_BIOOC|nr:unnamed protein product [Clonostachys rosea]
MDAHEWSLQFDVTDSLHQYQNVVPVRALDSPLLLNAICTASSRFLTIVWGNTKRAGPIQYNGITLPDLDAESALHYHNVCISYLMQAETNIAHNTDILIAITLLRYYEQVDAHAIGVDMQNYLHVVKVFFETRLKGEPAGLVGLLTMGLKDVHESATACFNSRSLSQSACLMALRQEVWSALIYGRPFEIPLSTVHDCIIFDWTSKDQFYWVSRVFVWLACILRLSYGTYQDEDDMADAPTKASSVSQRWRILKSFLDRWDQNPPSCFRPLWHEARDVSRGRIFPYMLMATSCQVHTLQNIELGRIMLTVYDPIRKRLGQGAASRERETADLVRESTWRVCGLGLSNSSQVSMVTACLAIALCSDFIDGREEQVAILDLLTKTERDHAWPVEQTIGQLRKTWHLGDAANIVSE